MAIRNIVTEEDPILRFPFPESMAEAYGLKGRRVTDRAQLEEAFRDALASNCGYVIDCVISPDEMVRPMVNSGSRITQFLID